MTPTPHAPLSPGESGAGPDTPTHEADVKQLVGKRLQKRRRDEPTTTVQLPEPLLGSDESADEDDGPSQGPPMFNMNQSIFGLIAAAGSRVDFNDRFDGSSSDEEDGHGKARDMQEEDLSQTTILQAPPEKKKSRAKKRLSESRLLRSLPVLPSRFKSRSKGEPSRLPAPAEEETEESPDTSDSAPAGELIHQEKRPAPVMSRMLEAKAEMSSRPSFDQERMSTDISRNTEGGDSTTLAKKLQQIFEFEQPEQVVEGR